MNRLSKSIIAFVNEFTGKEKEIVEEEVDPFDCEVSKEDAVNVNEAIRELESSELKRKGEERRLGLTGKRNREKGGA